jgi:hypothetical protein
MDSVVSTLKANWKNIAAVIFAVVAVIVGVVVWKRRQASKSKTTEDEDSDGENTAEVIYFFTTWCPHCKKSRPEWDAFSQKFNGKSINGYTVVVTAIDCDQQESVANKYDVKGYPTVKCIVNKKIADLDSPVTAENLAQFVQSCVA